MENFLHLFSSQEQIIAIFIKLFGIVLSFVYVLFSIVFVRQIGVMKKVVEIEDKGLLTLSGTIQLLLAATLFFYSLFIL